MSSSDRCSQRASRVLERPVPRLARARDQVRGQLAGGGDHAREAQRAAELHRLERLSCLGLA